MAVLYLYPYPYHDHPLQYPEPSPLTGWLRKGHLTEEGLVRIGQLTVWVRMG